MHEATPGGPIGLRVRYSAAMYHELSAAERGPDPHVAVAFQGGLYGYDAWVPTLQLVVAEIGSPLLVTSYNLAEAEDDEEVINDALGTAASWLWAPQANPWRSLLNERELRRRPPASHAAAQAAPALPALLENAAWQCVQRAHAADNSTGRAA